MSSELDWQIARREDKRRQALELRRQGKRVPECPRCYCARAVRGTDLRNKRDNRQPLQPCVDCGAPTEWVSYGRRGY